MNKRLLLIGTATLFILGACGNRGESDTNSPSNETSKVTANENELILNVNGTEKNLEAVSETLDDTVDIKMTKDFVIDRYDEGTL